MILTVSGIKAPLFVAKDGKGDEYLPNAWINI